MKQQKVFFLTVLTGIALSFTLSARAAVYSQANAPGPDKTARQQGVLVKCRLSYIISVPGKTNWVRLTALIPDSVLNIQKIDNVEYSIEPFRFFTKNGRRYAEIIIYNPGRIEKLVITISAELYRYDLQTAMSNKEKNQFQESGLEEFLKEEKYLEKTDSKIRGIARSITGSSEIEIVRNIYNYVLDNMEYVIQGKKDRGVLHALKYKKGDCSEYADLFVSLCRAKKIPARVVTGISVQADRKTAKHNWSEVYLEKYGWVPFDTSKGDVKIASLREKLFNTLETKYIYFSNLRNDGALQNFHYGLFTYFGDQVKVTDSIEFEFPKKSD